ncbi:bifunctional arginine demethylase and lysyl-hydroxylase psr-1 [Thecamonas trahens ATCC 50062]|uniref:Bifunctional arginine demethylase and lysyl-hydroxylase psr-1 n=1 Tax=Thecamonas trahens ATCC 50062 TaxID=461836 RepID=A0A0L0DJP6_THETB|nr:bifunctional arginine demethylase and lysyl-hydroxylase psr-1 [Thecamonas trahens ATCC 50062]KNC52634.1 bifunctional arginine demethylase and lysyl-hydroxylase psr-1 [Thecamonas trahens ATCC 50062]|eukprot:XP_013755187.1 bifunctional arginine demethylase and lysyl-hydroxylase psr-1 [Thecamonas trahens ATCC 50062]
MPCLLIGATDDWKAMRKWNRAKFSKRFGSSRFDVGSYNHTYMTYEQYLRYCDTNTDDSPLYIFEPQYATKFPKLLKEFSIPKYFTPEDMDLQSCMDDDPRPYYRWVLMGPVRSGTGIHQDPHMTSAWNALIQGHKRWCMFPPHIKGSIVKPKKGEPDSGIYWFHSVYPRLVDRADELGMIECVQGPGEIIFVPAGWWHVVLNLDFTISVTQNHVTDFNFERAFNSYKRSKPKKALIWHNSLPDAYKSRVEAPNPDDISSSSSSSYTYVSSSSSDDENSASDSGSGASASDSG